METRKLSMNLKLASLIIIIFAVLARLLPHAPNAAPITALALFGAVYLPKKFAFIPLIALFISDLFIGFYGITMIYVYSSFLLVGFIGLWLKSRKNTTNAIAAALISSVLFYLITNFGVWASPTSWYSKDIYGLIESYYFGLPFFRNTLLGDLGYTALFFGGYEILQILAKKYLPKRFFQLLY